MRECVFTILIPLYLSFVRNSIYSSWWLCFQLSFEYVVSIHKHAVTYLLLKTGPTAKFRASFFYIDWFSNPEIGIERKRCVTDILKYILNMRWWKALYIRECLQNSLWTSAVRTTAKTNNKSYLLNGM